MFSTSKELLQVISIEASDESECADVPVRAGQGVPRLPGKESSLSSLCLYLLSPSSFSDAGGQIPLACFPAVGLPGPRGAVVGLPGRAGVPASAQPLETLRILGHHPSVTAWPFQRGLTGSHEMESG